MGRKTEKNAGVVDMHMNLCINYVFKFLTDGASECKNLNVAKCQCVVSVFSAVNNNLLFLHSAASEGRGNMISPYHPILLKKAIAYQFLSWKI